MKCFVLAFFIVAGACTAQAPAGEAAKPSADTVIATIEGKKLTYGEFEKFVHGMPPQMQQNAARNRKQFIQQFALMRRLSEMAETAKLDEQSPYKEAIQLNRVNILMQAQINSVINGFPVRVEEQQKFYEENKSRWEQVNLKVIYISFSAAPASEGKKHLSEADAKAKAEQLVKEARGGADFVKLVKENSEDASSKEKNGDFGSVSRADNLPESIRSVVFGLKAGEVSDAVRQPNGFYVFRAESVSAKPFSEVRDQIFNEIKNQKLKEWLDATTKNLNITFEGEPAVSGSILPSLGAPLPNK